MRGYVPGRAAPRRCERKGPRDVADSSPDLPVACTLGPAALRARREDLLGGLVRRADDRIDLPNGYRIRFDAKPGLLSTIAGVIETERRCCRFLRFEVTVEPAERAAWVGFTGPPGTREFLAALLDL